MDIMIEKATFLQIFYFNRAKTKLGHFSNETKKVFIYRMAKSNVGR
jgi:hypothetical protein